MVCARSPPSRYLLHRCSYLAQVDTVSLRTLRRRSSWTFVFQVLSITDIEFDEQALTGGDSNRPIDTDATFAAALQGTGGGMYGNYPVVRVTKRVAGAGGYGGSGCSAQKAQSKTSKGVVDAASAWDECCSRT